MSERARAAATIVGWLSVACSSRVAAQEPTADEATDLANQLASPIADLVRIPLQSNFEIRARAGRRRISISAERAAGHPGPRRGDWLVITRVIPTGS